MKIKWLFLSIGIATTFGFTGYQKNDTPYKGPGTIKITFVNTVKGSPIQLNSSVYTNPFAETYTVSKFRYYISHVIIDSIKETESYHLIDEANPASLHVSFPLKAGMYQSISFLLGVDSLKNVNGAQTGALDPLNDMFWTWNSGYVMAKMEGKSPQSKMVNNKIEYHIGGFSGVNNVLKNITLVFPKGRQFNMRAGKTSELIIEADLDTWWQHPNDLKIADHPVCSTPGAFAKKIADNYSKMFTIKQVIDQ